MWRYASPREIVFGEDALETLAELEYRRVLIICGPTVKKIGILDEVSEIIKRAGAEVETIDWIEVEPSLASVIKSSQFAINFQPDCIIGLGGGSSIDAAKAIYALYERPDIDITTLSPLETLGLGKKSKLICIPTTSGSGSDSNWAVVLFDEENDTKMELASREVVPHLVLLDPKLVISMPPRITASSGIDALAHAIEAFVSQWRNDFSNAFAIRAIGTIFEYLVRSVENADDIEAREKMHYAATMAGIAFGNSGVGLAHAMAHAVGALFKMSHGVAVGIFLPHVIRFNAEVAARDYKEIIKAARLESFENPGELLANYITNLLKKINMPTKIGELGISQEEYIGALDALVERTVNSSGFITNASPLDKDECRSLLLAAF